MSSRLLEETLERIQPLEYQWQDRAREHHLQLTKPPGSLGTLEALGGQLCAIQQQIPPVIESTRVLVFAADHGLTRDHVVGPFPREVTAQMVVNFVNGGAAINALSRVVGASFCVIDMGVDTNFADFGLAQSSTFQAHSIARGTQDISVGPAMTKEQLTLALEVGIKLAEWCANDKQQAVAIGEMGIGNTSIASALTAAMLKLPVAEVTGRGTGADDLMLQRKVSLIKKAIDVNQANPNDGQDLLQKIGGFELAGIAGLCLGLARHRIAIVADGFISTAAVMAAIRIHPAVNDYVFCGHRSPEPGHQFLMEAMNKQPIHDLGLRLGEGTGACLSLTPLKAAAQVMSEMATFADAGVDDKS